MEMLRELARLGLVAVIDNGGELRYRLTATGHGRCQACCLLTGGTSFLDEPLAEPASMDTCPYDLLRLLLDGGWVCEYPPRRRDDLVAFSTADGSKKVWYATRGELTKMEVSKRYMLCLLRFQTLHENGIKEIEHRRPAAYYKDLLQQSGVESREPAECDEDSGSGSSGSRSSGSSGSSSATSPPPPPSCSPGSSRSSDSDTSARRADPPAVRAPPVPMSEPVPPVPAPPAVFVRVRRDGVQVGRFKLNRVKHVGEGAWPWQATCGLHRDAGDHPSTTCKKRLRVPTDEEECKTRLLQWCIAGLCYSRDPDDLPRTAHKDLHPADFPPQTWAETVEQAYRALRTE